MLNECSTWPVRLRAGREGPDTPETGSLSVEADRGAVDDKGFTLNTADEVDARVLVRDRAADHLQGGPRTKNSRSESASPDHEL